MHKRILQRDVQALCESGAKSGLNSLFHAVLALRRFQLRGTSYDQTGGSVVLSFYQC